MDSARGEQEVLDSTRRRVEIGRGIALTAETGPSSPLAVARNAEIHGRIKNPRQFETAVERALLPLILAGSESIRFQKTFMNRAAHGFIADHDKIPRLHEAY